MSRSDSVSDLKTVCVCVCVCVITMLRAPSLCLHTSPPLTLQMLPTIVMSHLIYTRILVVRAHFVGSGQFQALTPSIEHVFHAPGVRSDITH